MGDIASHGRIAAHVVEQLRKVASTTTIPTTDYSFLELGNFITDVEQLRDPVAFHKARELVRDEAKRAAGVGGFLVEIDRWANEMFGVKGEKVTGPRHGAVPEFLSEVARAFTHHVFDPDGLTAQIAKAPFAGAAASFLPLHPIDPAEVDRVLAARFDQYWPHDHVDFPPMRNGPRHRREQLFKPRSSGLITFIEAYLQLLSEELSKLELEWVQTLQTAVTDQSRRDFLVRLGNLLHAVEDFFFHSNVAEVRQFQLLRRRFRDADPATPEGRAELFEHGLEGTAFDRTSVRLRRILFRRLRYPVFVSDGASPDGFELSRRTSEDGTGLLFTGGFYSTDVYHTLGGALEAIEDLTGIFGADDPTKSHLVLVRLTFNEAARRALRFDQKGVEAAWEEHAKQLLADEYPKAIAALRQKGTLSNRAAERMTAAFQMDRSQEEFSAFLPGPGGFMINLLVQLQNERTDADLLAGSLDGDRDSMTGEGSVNGVSAENVGTHTLLSKDSRSKQPFLEDAVALAKHASASVATMLIRRLESGAPTVQGVDWDAVLRFFVRFPEFPSGRWEEELIWRLRAAGDDFKQPDVDDVVDQPKFPLLGPPGPGAEKLAQRRAGTLRLKLEQYYRSFESDPP